MESTIFEGISLIQTLQISGPILDSLMSLITFLGTIEFYLLFLPIIYWNLNTRLGFRVLLLLMITGAVTASLKLLLHQPRPYWLGTAEQLVDESTYGFPSLHASGSLAIWGYLAYRSRKAWAYIASAVLILLIGISRPYLGAHYTQDVLGGWIIGLAILVIFIFLDGPVGRWLDGWNDWARIGLGFAGSLSIVAAGVLIRASIAGEPDPVSWGVFADQARSLSPFVTLGGALFGSTTGYVLMNSRVRLNPGGPLMRHILRYLLGIAGVVLIWRGLDLLFQLAGPEESAAGLTLRYFRYALTTLWVFFGAPWLFTRLKLAAGSEEHFMKSDTSPE